MSSVVAACALTAGRNDSWTADCHPLTFSVTPVTINRVRARRESGYQESGRRRNYQAHDSQTHQTPPNFQWQSRVVADHIN
jgi:hypothetical protein